jgi:hypothetical protein
MEEDKLLGLCSAAQLGFEAQRGIVKNHPRNFLYVQKKISLDG